MKWHDVVMMKEKHTMPAKSKSSMKERDIQNNPDPGIDRDYPGFPHNPSSKRNITPKSATEKKTAAVKKKATKKTYGK